MPKQPSQAYGNRRGRAAESDGVAAPLAHRFDQARSEIERAGEVDQAHPGPQGGWQAREPVVRRVEQARVCLMKD
jgi:hypothetical protein